MRRYFLILLMSCIGPNVGRSQPQPGEIFREYIWTPKLVEAEAGKFLRVGGRLDYKTNAKHLAPQHHDDGYIRLSQYLQLEGARKAEVMVEKIASHEDTRDLQVSFNRNPFVLFPAAPGIPKPQSDYMHHTYPTVPISLSHLNEGWNNQFRLEVDTAQVWNWPQNLIHGLILRIYYSPEQHSPKGLLTGVKSGDLLPGEVELSISNPNQSIRQVDYLGYYEGVNWEGDGLYQQWHYHFLRGQIKHHIGTATDYPFKLVWDCDWVPDQEEIKLAARIIDNSGLIYFTPEVEELSFDRNHAVELVKPFDQPKNWVTRAAEFDSKMHIGGDLEKASSARILWTSWSPCYANGIFVNGHKVIDREGPCYDYMAHDILLPDISILKPGLNIISTGKEPLHDGQMVHGMEVQWPGIMMLIKYNQ